MRGLYLLGLLVGIGGLLVLDWRYRLAWFRDTARTAKTLGASLAIFLAWDITGIMLKIFFVGDSKFMSGIRLWHELPLEEQFFLFLLVYCALVIWRLLEEKCPRI